MWYFGARANLRFLKEFREVLIEFLQLHDYLCNPGAAIESPERFQKYPSVRSQYSGMLTEAEEVVLARGGNVGLEMYAPPAAGGFFRGRSTVFQILLDDDMMRLQHFSPLTSVDSIDMAIGECKRAMRRERWYLINPIYWAYALVRKIVHPAASVLKMLKIGDRLSESITSAISALLTAVGGTAAVIQWRTEILSWLQQHGARFR